MDKTFYLFPPIQESWVDQDAQGFVNDVVYASIYSGESQLQRLMKTGALNDLAVINSALQEDFTVAIKNNLRAYPALKNASLKDLSLSVVNRVVKVSGRLEIESANGKPMVRTLVVAELPS